MEKIQLTGQCPVTGGLPLKCTEKGFREACARFRESSRDKAGSNMEKCTTCHGKVPGEVVFVGLEYVKPGVVTAMSEQSKKSCALCGEERNVKSQYGKDVCSYCQIVRLQAKNRPDVLIKALQEFQQLPNDFEQLGPSDLQTEVERLRAELAAARNALLVGTGHESVPSLKAELLAATRKLEAANMHILRLEQMQGRNLNVERLQELAWKFAEGVMTGEVVGVDVDDIRLLRGIG